jgi:hypothetical protein
MEFGPANEANPKIANKWFARPMPLTVKNTSDPVPVQNGAISICPRPMCPRMKFLQAFLV